MKIGILGGVGSWHANQLQIACATRELSVMPIDYPQLAVRLGFRSNSYDMGQSAILVRHVPAGSMDQTLHYLNILHSQSMICRVINPARSIELATDKVLAGIQLQQDSVPIPRTIATDSLSIAMDSYMELGGDVVIKPLTGSLGRGIARLQDRDIAWRVFHAIIQVHGTIVLQEYIDTNGHDLRLFVIGQRVVAAMRRAAPWDWRYNIARGAVGTAYTPTERQRELAIRTAAAVGTDYAGVDILHDRHGNDYVVEINAIPGWKTLSKVTGINIADLIVEHMVKLL